MQWSSIDRIINISWFFAWVVFGIFSLYVHNNLLPYIYAAFCVGVAIAHFYLYCTRCPHYGQNCYIMGGAMSKNMFRNRKTGPLDPDDSICASLWLLVAMFPVSFLLYYQDWVLIFIYLCIVTGWFLQHSQTACPKCGNTWCALNPKIKMDKKADKRSVDFRK